MKQQADLEKDAIVPLFFKYYIPSITGLLSVTVNQVIDGLILGKYVGETGVAAVGLFGPVITVFIAFLLILVIGGGIHISKNIGSKNYEVAQTVFLYTTSWILLTGVLFYLSAPFAPKLLAQWLAGIDNEQLYQHTYDYMFWAFLWIPFFFIRVLWGSFINHDNAPKVSRNASLIAVAFNIVLNILFVIVLDMGVSGASIASGIAVLIAVAYLLNYLLKEKGHLKIRKFRFQFYFSEWRALTLQGVPTFVSEISFSAGLLLINTRLVPYGEDAVATFGIISFISFIFLRFFTSAMVSALPIMSFNIGARQADRVLATLRFSTLFTFVLGIAIVVIGFLGSSQLISLFSNNTDPDFMLLATHALGLFFLFFLAAGPNYLLAAYLQSTGKLKLSILLNSLKGIILVWLFLEYSSQINLGIDGIWLARPFSEVVAFLAIGLLSVIRWNRYFSKEAIIPD